MQHGHWNEGWGGIPIAAMMVIFWGGLIWLAIAVLRRTSHPNASAGAAAPDTSTSPPVRTPQSVLAERLALGEMDPDDDRQRLQALRDDIHDR